MNEVAIAKTIAKYYENLAAMNREGWLEILAKDAIIRDPVDKPPLTLGEESQKFFDLLSRFYQSFEISIARIITVGDRAAVQWKMEVKSQNNRSATAEGISTFEFNGEGKITKVESYWDEPGFKSKLI